LRKRRSGRSLKVEEPEAQGNADSHVLHSLEGQGVMQPECAGTLTCRSSSLRIREGKGGREEMVGFSNDCGAVMKDNLESRPPLEIEEKSPVLYRLWGSVG
jgi:hypothetical protein